MILTFLDAGVLIAAVRGHEEVAARALALLEDPARGFVTSDFLRMEVMPKAVYYQRPAEVALYARYFAKARFVPMTEACITRAYTAACTFGLSALDALHITMAKTGGAEECITTEKPTQPLYRVMGMMIKPLTPEPEPETA